MEEKIIAKGKNGMLVLLLNIVLYLVAIAGIVFGALMLDEELVSKVICGINNCEVVVEK